MPHNLTREKQHQLMMASSAAAWLDWQFHVECEGMECPRGRYRLMRDLVPRFPDDTLREIAARAWCRACQRRPYSVWLYRPALGNRFSERRPVCTAERKSATGAAA